MSEPKSRRIPKPIWFAAAAVLMVALWIVLAVWLPYHKEQVAIREIERMGGEVETYWYGPEWIEVGPEWLQTIVNDWWLSWFNRVRLISFVGTQVSDEELNHLKKYLSGLTNLYFLNLGNTQISDEGLKHIRGLINLEGLWLDNTQISDEGLKHLSGLTKLEELDLRNTRVSDEGLKNLGGLKNLVGLYLENTQVTEEGLKHLTGLTNLREF